MTRSWKEVKEVQNWMVVMVLLMIRKKFAQGFELITAICIKIDG